MPRFSTGFEKKRCIPGNSFVNRGSATMRMENDQDDSARERTMNNRNMDHRIEALKARMKEGYGSSVDVQAANRWLEVAIKRLEYAQFSGRSGVRGQWLP